MIEVLEIIWFLLSGLFLGILGLSEIAPYLYYGIIIFASSAFFVFVSLIYLTVKSQLNKKQKSE